MSAEAPIDGTLSTLPPAVPKRSKSPPLAFEPTPNDSLAPLRSPQHNDSHDSMSRKGSAAMATRRDFPASRHDGGDLEGLVEQQAAAMHLLHEAFALERQTWSLERDRLHQRIVKLEKLLKKTGDGHSPAKSPASSPAHSGLCSPQHRAASQRLSSIPEDDGLRPTTAKRDGRQPDQTDLPIQDGATDPAQPRSRNGSVTFGPTLRDQSAPIIVEEIPRSPPTTARGASPLPPENLRNAGHTPPHGPRPPTPPPKNTNILDGMDDTPTRNNTHMNSMLSRQTSEEQDRELTGPLNMPELPHMPEATNFTIDMLSQRLAQIEQNPERNKPLVFSTRSPGLATPPGETSDNISPNQLDKSTEGPLAPAATRQSGWTMSNVLSPQRGASGPHSGASSNGAALSQVESHESQVQQDFEQGGIRLKKKSSTNFGMPFGMVGGFGSMRKSSEKE